MGSGRAEPYYRLPPELQERAELSADSCVIELPEVTHFFIRGRLEIPIVGSEDLFVWLVWTSLSEKSFRRVTELWEQPGREGEPPYFGWLCSELPYSTPTLGLKTHVHTRPVGERPFVEVEQTDHPLAIEQRAGITRDRVQAIAELFAHRG